jgi:hypothetical protein
MLWIVNPYVDLVAFQYLLLLLLPIRCIIISFSSDKSQRDELTDKHKLFVLEQNGKSNETHQFISPY